MLRRTLVCRTLVCRTLVCRTLVCRTLVCRTLVFALVLFSTAAFDAKTRPQDRNAILISWDGALREHVRADLAQGKLPSLARLTKSGALVDIDVTGHQTDTKAGHTQMLTGYGPELTGVYSDGKFDSIPSGYSIFERLTQSYGKQGITTIMLTGKDHNLGSRGPGLLSHGEPFFLSRAGITVWDGDEMRPASVVGDKAVNYIRNYASKGRFSAATVLVKVRRRTTARWWNAIDGWAGS
jgi:hypothetical protein